MFDRREVLLSGAAACALAATPALADAPGDKLSKLFDGFMAETLDASPEFTTSLGLDSGARAYEKSKLDQRSLAEIAADKARNTRQLKALEAFDRSSLSGPDQISYDVVMFNLKSEDVANKRYAYGPAGAGAPYILSQLTGAYSNLPDFLDSQHQIAVKADADAYIARLEAMPQAFDQEIEVVRHDVALGCVPPDFALAKTLQAMAQFRGVAPAQSDRKSVV